VVLPAWPSRAANHSLKFFVSNCAWKESEIQATSWRGELSLNEGDQLLVGQMEGTQHSEFAKEEGLLNTKCTFFQVRKGNIAVS
jgi:hypothetical protein